MSASVATTQRLLWGTPGTLSMSVSVDGTLTDPGITTVTITRADGSAVVTDATTSGTGAAGRSYTLAPSMTTMLDVLTATWTTEFQGTVVTQAEIVGAHLFSVVAARSFDKGQLSDPTAYPAGVIEAARARISDAFADICNVSFIPRYRRVTLAGGGTDMLFLPDFEIQAIRSIETRSGTTWTALSVDDLADVAVEPNGILVRESGVTFPIGRANVRVAYEHGFLQPPLEITRAGLKVLVASAVPSNLPERARTLTDELGTFSFVTPGQVSNAWSIRSWFGIPEVDEVLSRYQHSYPAVG